MGILTAWIARLRWKLTSKKNVRIQYKNNAGAIDGILIGTWKKNYVLVNSYWYEHKPGAQGVEILGKAYVPRSEVLLMNEKD